MDTVRSLGHEAPVAKLSNALMGKFVGLAIVSLVPALFWTGVLALVGAVFGMDISGATLAFVGVSITVFLSLVFSSLALLSMRERLDA